MAAFNASKSLPMAHASSGTASTAARSVWRAAETAAKSAYGRFRGVEDALDVRPLLIGQVENREALSQVPVSGAVGRRGVLREGRQGKYETQKGGRGEPEQGTSHETPCRLRSRPERLASIREDERWGRRFT